MTLSKNHKHGGGTGDGSKIPFNNLNSVLNGSRVSGIATWYSEDNVTNPPTKAEIVAIFGDTSRIREGVIAIINDNGGDTNVWICFTSKTEWYYIAATKAL